LTLTGNLNVTAAGITDSGTLAIGGSTSLTAGTGNNITLDNANNFGGAVSATGNSIRLADVDAMTLGPVTSVGDLTVNAGGTLTVSGNTSAATVSLNGVGIANTASIVGTSSLVLDAGTGMLNNSGGTVANGGAGSAIPVVLKGDSMSLAGGAIKGNSALITLTSSTRDRTINLATGSGLVLTQGDLNSLNTSGGLLIGGPTHTGDIIVGGVIGPIAGLSGGLTINNGYDLTGGPVLGRILDSGTGLLNVADNIKLSAYGDIGSSAASVHLGAKVRSVISSTEANNATTYISMSGPLVIDGVKSPGGQVFYAATGPITQTSPVFAESLHATVEGSGGITLKDNLNKVSHLYLDAPGVLTYHQVADYTVVKATGNGMNFSSHGNLNLAAVISGGPLDIDAGTGDVSLSTTGEISISGPGKVLGRNLNFNFANAVNFSGGSNIVNPRVSNDLSIKASGNLSINASALTVTGGTTLAGAGQNLKNDVVISAGDTLTIITKDDFILGGGAATATAPGAQAQASAFLTADKLDLKIGRDFRISGGTASLGGGEANASAIVLVNSGKEVDIKGNFVLTGGTITGVGSSATALAVFDPELVLKIKTGGSVVVVGGSTPSTSSKLLAYAAIMNAGPIKFTIEGSGAFVHPSPAIATLLGPGIKAGLIVAGGKGSGLYDVYTNPVTTNDYPISYQFTNGGAFTVITDMTGYADGLIQSRAPLGVDESLMAYINFAINTETVAKGRRGTSDQGNFKRRTAGQCS
jgi:hypothetical protein